MPKGNKKNKKVNENDPEALKVSTILPKLLQNLGNEH